jgi:phosphatidylglycerophosphatase C
LNSGGLAVFDLDGTIARHDTFGPYLWGYLWRRPWRLPRALLALPAAARFLVNRDRGAFKGAVIHALLGGAKRASLDLWAALYVAALMERGLYAEALSAIAMHRARGDRLLLMSASTDLDGRLDGRLATANCRGEEKRRCLAAVIARDAPGRVYAYGDSRADLDHMQLAQEGYLINVSPRQAARLAPHVQAIQWNQPAGI